MNKKTLIIIICIVSFLILLLPIFINILLRIDWFSSIVMGGESGWLSFYGSYLGGILGGLLTLVGVFLTIRYQDDLRKQELRDREVRDIKHISRIMDTFYLHLSFVLKALKEEFGDDFVFEESLKHHLTEIEAVREKLEEFTLQNIPKDSLDDFLTVKEHLEMIKSMLSGVYMEKLDTRQAVVEKLNKLPFIQSIKYLLECHKRFSETSASMHYLIVQLDMYERREE